MQRRKRGGREREKRRNRKGKDWGKTVSGSRFAVCGIR
jgi:hypothetical protein